MLHSIRRAFSVGEVLWRLKYRGQHCNLNLDRHNNLVLFWSFSPGMPQDAWVTMEWLAWATGRPEDVTLDSRIQLEVQWTMGNWTLVLHSLSRGRCEPAYHDPQNIDPSIHVGVWGVDSRQIVAYSLDARQGPWFVHNISRRPGARPSQAVLCCKKGRTCGGNSVSVFNILLKATWWLL